MGSESVESFKGRLWMDDRRWSMIHMSNDILIIISDLLPIDDLRSLCLVNSQINILAREGLYRHVDFVLNDDDQPNDRLTLEHVERKGFLHALRSLRVYDSFQIDERLPSMERAAYLCKIIPLMTGLQHVEWRGRVVDRSIVNTLRACPKAKLSVLLSLGAIRNSNTDSTLRNIKGSANLCSLDLEDSCGSKAYCSAVHKELKQLIFNCPNLRRLKLDIPCIHYFLTFLSPGYCRFIPGEVVPAFEELHLEPYFYDKSEIQRCFNRFDWSRLRKLSTFDPFLALELVSKCTALKEIEFHCSDDRGEMSIFCEQIQSSLESIATGAIKGVFVEGILRHGCTLRSLKLSQCERHKKPWADEAPDAATIEAIRKSCPNIKTIGIDLARANEWPYHALDILASFPRLQELALWFELGINTPKNPVQPFVTFNACSSLFKHLRGRNQHLKIVQVHSGAPSLVESDQPCNAWIRRNSLEFICELSKRDDEAAEAKFTTSCTKLGDRGNAFLRDVQEGKYNTEEYEEELENVRKEPLTSALTRMVRTLGPTNVDELIRLARFGPRAQ